MNPNYEQLCNFATAACDGSLSEAEQRALDCLLAQSKEARIVWLSYSWLHTELTLQTRAGSVLQESILAIQESEEHPIYGELNLSESIAPSSLEPASSHSARSRRAKQKYYSWWLAGLAAMVALAAFASHYLPTPNSHVVASVPQQPNATQGTAKVMAERQPRPIATVIRGRARQDIESELTAGQAPAPELVLFEGDRFELESGEARLSMAGGANILVAAPASIVATSANHIQLLEGMLTARLPQWATGFMVDTPAMSVTDLGTTFSISAESNDAAEARVLEGLITVRPQLASREKSVGLVLNEGESVRVVGNHAERSRGSGNPEQDAESLDELSRERPYKPIHIPGTGLGLRVGDEDPYWRIVGAPDGTRYSTPCYAVVCSEDPKYAPNEADKSQWISFASDLPDVVANQIYTFETSIDLTGYAAETVHIQCQVLADNGVRAIRVNGKTIDLKPWTDNLYGQTFAKNEFRAIDIVDGLVAGRNLVEFDVWNGGMRGGRSTPVLALPNPTALRVEWHAFGEPEKLE